MYFVLPMITNVSCSPMITNVSCSPHDNKCILFFPWKQMYLVLPMITNVSYSPHDVANKLFIWCLTIITHSAPYQILGDAYFVVLGICVEYWLRLMTFWHKLTTPMMSAVVPTSSVTVFKHLHMAAGPKNNNRLEQMIEKHNQQYITGLFQILHI